MKILLLLAAAVLVSISASPAAVGGQQARLPDWHRELLLIADEPSFTSPRHPIAEEYRLVYSGAFNYPIILRVSQTRRGAVLHAMQLGGNHVFRERHVELSPSQWRQVVLMVDKSKFWGLDPEEKDDPAGSDGTTWLFEGRRAAAYHAVTRWMPSFEADRRDLQGMVLCGRFLMKLSGLGGTIL